jgi:hypothetical protein
MPQQAIKNRLSEAGGGGCGWIGEERFDVGIAGKISFPVKPNISASAPKTY